MKVNPSSGFSIVGRGRTIKVPGSLCAKIAAIPEIANYRKRCGDKALSTAIVSHIRKIAGIVETQPDYWAALEKAIRDQTPKLTKRYVVVIDAEVDADYTKGEFAGWVQGALGSDVKDVTAYESFEDLAADRT